MILKQQMLNCQCEIPGGFLVDVCLDPYLVYIYFSESEFLMSLVFFRMASGGGLRMRVKNKWPVFGTGCLSPTGSFI